MFVHTRMASSYRGFSALVKLQLCFQTALTDFSGSYARELIVLCSCKELSTQRKLHAVRREFGETEGLGKNLMKTGFNSSLDF